MDITILPNDLQEQAIILSGEPAWPKKPVRDVILHLSSNGYAVLGLEVWLPEGDVPKVVGWSEYNIEDFENWNDYVSKNQRSALDDLNKLPDGDELYNLTWINEKEYRDLTQSR